MYRQLVVALLALALAPCAGAVSLIAPGGCATSYDASANYFPLNNQLFGSTTLGVSQVGSPDQNRPRAAISPPSAPHASARPTITAGASRPALHRGVQEQLQVRQVAEQVGDVRPLPGKLPRRLLPRQAACPPRPIARSSACRVVPPHPAGTRLRHARLILSHFSSPSFLCSAGPPSPPPRRSSGRSLRISTPPGPSSSRSR